MNGMVSCGRLQIHIYRDFMQIGTVEYLDVFGLWRRKSDTHRLVYNQGRTI